MTETETRAVDPRDALATGDLVTGQELGGEGGEGDRPADDVIRGELRARGHVPSTRGRLSRAWIEIWESGETAAAIAAELAAEAAAAGDGGVGPGDFEPDHARQVNAETRPTRPRARGLRDRLGLGGDTGSGKRKSGKEKTGPRQAPPKHARVPLDRLGEGVFGLAARLTGNADPAMSRLLAVEAPLGGLVIDRTLKGTVADRALQPVARAQAKVDVLGALLGLPFGLLIIEQAQTLPPERRGVREAIGVTMMRESAVTLAEFAGENLAERAEREAERAGLYAQADAILQHILYGDPLGPPDPGQAYPGAPGPGPWPVAEDQAAETAQQGPGTYGGFMAPPPAPAGDPARPQYAHPYPPASPAAVLALRQP